MRFQSTRNRQADSARIIIAMANRGADSNVLTAAAQAIQTTTAQLSHPPLFDAYSEIKKTESYSAFSTNSRHERPPRRRRSSVVLLFFVFGGVRLVLEAEVGNEIALENVQFILV